MYFFQVTHTKVKSFLLQFLSFSDSFLAFVGLQEQNYF